MAEEYKVNKEKLEKETKMREDMQKNLGKITNERNDLRAELDTIQDVLDEAEFRAEQLQQQKIMLEEKVSLMKDNFDGNTSLVENMQEERDNMNAQIQALEDKLKAKEEECDKLTADRRGLEKQISHLEEDVSMFKDQISKMANEKEKLLSESELVGSDLSSLEEKCSSLTFAKQKLDEVHHETLMKLDSETKARENLWLLKTRLENDLRHNTEKLLDLQKTQQMTSDGLARHKFDYEQTATRLEDEQAQVANLLKKIKELQQRIHELEQEVVEERDLRSKSDRLRTDVKRDLDDALEQLRIANTNNKTKDKGLKDKQIEFNRLRLEFEESKAHHEVFIQTLKQRQGLENEEATQQYDMAIKQKARLEEERNEACRGMETMTRNIELLTKSKVHNERQIKKLTDEKKEGDEALEAMNEDLEKKQKEIEDAADEAKAEHKKYGDLEYQVCLILNIA